jgi:hypothetical protein
VKSVLVLDDDLLVVRYIRAVLQPVGLRMLALNNVAAAYGGFDLLIVKRQPRGAVAELAPSAVCATRTRNFRW